MICKKVGNVTITKSVLFFRNVPQKTANAKTGYVNLDPVIKCLAWLDPVKPLFPDGPMMSQKDALSFHMEDVVEIKTISTA